PLGASVNVSPPTDITCATGLAKTPCQYATLNGYGSPVSSLTANTAGYTVGLAFPSATAVADCPSGGTCPAPGFSPPPSGLLPSAWGTRPWVKVTIVDRVQVFFLGLFTGAKTRDISAFSTCGLVAGSAPSPITVLGPSAAQSLKFAGT